MSNVTAIHVLHTGDSLKLGHLKIQYKSDFFSLRKRMLRVVKSFTEGSMLMGGGDFSFSRQKE